MSDIEINQQGNLYGEQRDELRCQFYDAFDKYQNKFILTGLEQQIISAILEHPEYLYLFENRDKYIDKDFQDQNPFLHLSLHLTLKDQIKLNRPNGITEIHTKLTQKLQNPHTAEHLMMESLSEELWQIQRGGQFDEGRYVGNLGNLLRF